MIKPHLPSCRWLLFFFCISLACLALDLQTKSMIAGKLGADQRTPDQWQRQVVIPHWFSLLYNHELNQGTLFSIGNKFGVSSNYILMGMCLLAVVGILGWVFLWPGMKRPFFALTLGLILGGALGNFYDRLIYGGVRDWIWVYYERGPNDFPFNWPVFNLADCFLVSGVILLALDNLFFAQNTAKPASPP